MAIKVVELPVTGTTGTSSIRVVVNSNWRERLKVKQTEGQPHQQAILCKCGQHSWQPIITTLTQKVEACRNSKCPWRRVQYRSSPSRDWSRWSYFQTKRNRK